MKSTKKSLLLSTLSLVLCFTMLLGTTYAWFTDEVKSGTNKIIAGNLDVELYHQSKNVEKTKVTETTNNLFKDVALWEPGAYSYETFTIENVGNLALKYKMALNVVGYTSYNGHNLTEVIKVATMDSIPASRDEVAILEYKSLSDWSFSDTGLSPAENKTLTVVLYWKPDNNEYDNLFNMNNGKPQPLSIDLGVQLVATQLENESDSFDNQYDKDVPNDPTPVTPTDTQLLVKMSEEATEDIEIEKQGKIEGATVPKEDANEIFNAMKVEGAVENNLTLSLNVQETTSEEDKAEGKFSFNIDMTAIMESIKNGEKSTKEENVNNLSKFVEVQLNLGAGYLGVDATHDGVAMTKVANKEAIETAESNDAGYYNYNSDSGIATIWTKTFSPFVFEGEPLKTDAELLAENPNYTCRIGNQGYVNPFGENTTAGKASSALKDAQSGDTIKLMADYVSTNDYFAHQKTNDCKITIDLNGKKIQMKNAFQPSQGIYTIIDSSEGKTGSINKVALYNYQQDSYNTTLNVYAGKIDKISTAVPGSYNVNIYGGEIGFIELQDKAKGVNCTINGGTVSRVAVYNDMNAEEYFTFAEGYSLGEEIVGQNKIAIYGSEFMANAYKVYEVVNP